MNKYAVPDVLELQRDELEDVRAKLARLTQKHEKTASESLELKWLELREQQLALSLDKHS